jgi:hypothetical protein
VVYHASGCSFDTFDSAQAAPLRLITLNQL